MGEHLRGVRTIRAAYQIHLAAVAEPIEDFIEILHGHRRRIQTGIRIHRREAGLQPGFRQGAARKVVEVAVAREQIAAKRAVVAGAALIDEQQVARGPRLCKTLRHVTDEVGRRLPRASGQKDERLTLRSRHSCGDDDDAKRDAAASTRASVFEHVSHAAARRAIQPHNRAGCKNDRFVRASSRRRCAGWQLAARGQGEKRSDDTQYAKGRSLQHRHANYAGATSTFTTVFTEFAMKHA